MPEQAALILVVEDEPPLRKFLCAALQAAGYRVVEAQTGQQGLNHAALSPPDVVLLDLGLPDMDGLVVTQRLREWSRAPIVVISARGQEGDKVEALDAGADDYLTKPFSVGELLARVRVSLRHAAGGGGGHEPIYTQGDLSIDLAARRVQLRGQDVKLTNLQYRLLTTLARNAGKVMTHRQLLHEVWGPGSGNETHYLRVYMAQLRHKLEDDPAQPRYLLTEQGVGYRMAMS
ncbi:MAG: response regulator [Phycisphaeraceae bacterium]